ncbi:hypothetical protein SAICODRAFT_161137 [Saitoella complicata NRRL Y-17804]|uniref:uncharacterized protein n=1 Tax=Saitoella complicata (strain BCRC 22490 / CBS 7301 / JCM 7358 / NBRC 10748 / NRRL Y-17804) TaxID=698492 RepID=UPI0008674FF2|nr:uncharacterized protein SAICODRAFT_161137 [Saitoella complicata NRRL Y-17804]ODQ50998.1 hypothetical protein SAICODRAFT_161137 [Saitoella complicata NRRL Y-17804]
MPDHPFRFVGKLMSAPHTAVAMSGKDSGALRESRSESGLERQALQEGHDQENEERSRSCPSSVRRESQSHPFSYRPLQSDQPDQPRQESEQQKNWTSEEPPTPSQRIPGPQTKLQPLLRRDNVWSGQGRNEGSEHVHDVLPQRIVRPVQDSYAQSGVPGRPPQTAPVAQVAKRPCGNSYCRPLSFTNSKCQRRLQYISSQSSDGNIVIKFGRRGGCNRLLGWTFIRKGSNLRITSSSSKSTLSRVRQVNHSSHSHFDTVCPDI